MKKILFIGPAESSHSVSWIELLEHSEIEHRLFALPNGAFPSSKSILTYLSSHRHLFVRSKKYVVRIPLIPRLNSLIRFVYFHVKYKFLIRFKSLKINLDSKFIDHSKIIQPSLISVVKRFKPQVVHTFGIFDSSIIFLDLKTKFPEISWVVQVRGGPDLSYHKTGSVREKFLIYVLSNADKIICDSETNYKLALKFNANREKFFGIAISGTGGMDIQGFRTKLVVNSNHGQKIIVWPKAYETISAKALPVLEGIKIAWEQIKPCEFRFLWVTQEEIAIWIQNNFSTELRNSIKIFPRLSRSESIKHISDANILLSPSLMDGIPNTLLEAMTLGTIPIVSPLESIKSLVSEPSNVYFARNLYPTEIAQALIACLNDPVGNLVKIQNNLSIIKEKYDREIIRDKVLNFYENLF